MADGTLMPFFALGRTRTPAYPRIYRFVLGCYAGGELLATRLSRHCRRVGRRRAVDLDHRASVSARAALLRARGHRDRSLAHHHRRVRKGVLHPTAATAIADVVPERAAAEHFALTRIMSNAGASRGRRWARLSRCGRSSSCSSALPRPSSPGPPLSAAFMPEDLAARPAPAPATRTTTVPPL